MKEKVVGLKDLRENMEKYAAEVQSGKKLIVVKRSKGLFRIVPLEEEWETVIDFTKIPGYEKGIDAEELLATLVELRKEDEQAKKATSKTRQL